MNSLPMLRSALRTRTSAFAPRLCYSTAAPSSNAAESSEASSSAPSSSSSPASSTSPPPPPTTPSRSAVLDKIAEDLRAKKPAGGSSNSASSFTPNPSSARSQANSDRYAWQGIFEPSSSSARSQPPPTIATPEDNWRTSQIVGYSAPVTTTTARSFEVKAGDVGRAFRMLNRTLRENNVRRELKRQERFESGSDKRVRLDSERHRKRFKVAVGKAVSLAMRMKDM